MAAAPSTKRGNSARRAAPGAADVERRMRLTLDRAQQKLLASQLKLQTRVAALRAELAPATASSTAGIHRDG